MRSKIISLYLLSSALCIAQINNYQAPQPYGSNAYKVRISGSMPTPDFQVNFDSSITPEIGTSGTFTRATARNYWNASDVLSSVTANNPAVPAYQLDNDSIGGYAMYSGTTNYALQSEAPATTWTAVGVPTRANGVGTFFTNISYGTVAGNSGEGITQTLTGLAAASKTILLSFFGQAVTSAFTVRLTIEGASGGTPETLNQDVIVTPNEPSRYYVYKAFSGSATGDVKITITLRATGTLRIGGIMAESKETDANTDQYTRIPGPYIKTTTATVAHDPDVLLYPADNISNVSQFTFSMWLNSDWRIFGSATQYRDMSPGNRDKYALRVRDAGNNVICELHSAAGDSTMNLGVNGAEVTALFERHHSRKWYQYVVTIDYINDIYKIYRNGLLAATGTDTLATPGAASTFYIGSPNGYRQWNGIIHDFKYYARVLNASQVVTLFQSEVADHTEGTFNDGWPLSPNWHDPYTVAMWDFSESSGSIVDEVNGIILTANGSPTYSTTATGHFADISPGITYGSGASHRKLTDTTELDFDASTDNQTIEIYLKKTSTSGEQNIITSLGNASTTDYGWRIYFSDDLTIKLDIQDDALNTGQSTWVLPNSLVDGSEHKLRFRFGRNTTVRLWVDEVLHETEGDSSAIGAVTNTGVRIGEKYDGSGGNFIGTIFSVRITKATSDASVTMTNSGGPIRFGSD